MMKNTLSTVMVARLLGASILARERDPVCGRSDRLGGTECEHVPRVRRGVGEPRTADR